MNYKLCFFTLLLFIFPPICSGQISSGGSFSLEKSVIATGGGESSNGAFSITGTSGQNSAGTVNFNSEFNQIGGFWPPDQLAPTAAMVSVGGKITTANGNGIRNVMVTLRDTNGATRTTVTGSFGWYLFTDVEVGQTYILTVQARKYIFSNPTQIVSVNDELTDVNFIAND